MVNSTAYYNDFWNEMRGKQAVTDSLYNNRESKTNAYHLPGESNKKYTAVLRKESAVRQLATIVNATGAFTGDDKYIILTVLSPSQAVKLRNFIKEHDPKAFLLISNTSEIIGKGFHSV